MGHVYATGNGPGVDGDDQPTLAALDEDTGEVQWAVALSGFPCGLALGPDAVYVAGFADSRVQLMAHDPSTGDELWVVRGARVGSRH